MSFLVKDPTLKLFGKTIPLNQSSLIPDPPPVSRLSASPDSSQPLVLLSVTSCLENSADEEDDDDRETSRREISASHQNPEQTTSSGVSESSRKSSLERETSVERETSALKPFTNGGQSQEETSALKPSTNGGQSQEEVKTLKKPDKLLPCPRCNSTRTKFCYYNNYSVNQPRHFCKNCQRYWTAGGTMRSVPVGAGRRKNRNSPVLPYPQILVSMSAAHRNPQDYTQKTITVSKSLEKESKTRNEEQMVNKSEPFPPLQWSPQCQPTFCSSLGFPVSCYPFPFWSCNLPSSWMLPSSWLNPTVLMPNTSIIDDVMEGSFLGFQSKRDEQSHVRMFPLL